MKSEYLAAIDLGTNSFHMVVVEIFENHKFEVVTSEKSVVRLGSGGDDMGQISADAQERGIQALGRFVEIASSYKAPIRAVATSALREAPNRQDFLERARQELGLTIQVIEGSEEARLIYLGIIQSLNVKDKQVLAIDIGGGSTEFVIGKNSKPAMAVSLKLGAIRLTHRFFTTPAIQKSQIDECRRFIRVMLSGVAEKTRALGYEIAIGSSGTAETLEEMIRARQNNHNANEEIKESLIHFDDLQDIIQGILDIPTAEERVTMSGLDQKRADIIVGGAILLEEIFKALRIESMQISNYALREGVIADYITRHQQKGQISRDIRRHSVYHLAKRVMNENSAQYKSSAHVSFLAARIFDQLLLQGLLPEVLGLNESFLLEASAMLHNLGLVVAHSAHHKHSYYIIKNSDKLLGFSKIEIEVVAQIARYHRKKKPTSKHEAFDALQAADQVRVRWLAGILRIAIGLDRRHQQRVADLQIEQSNNELVLQANAQSSRFAGKKRDIQLEIWAAQNSRDLLEDCLEQSILIQ